MLVNAIWGQRVKTSGEIMQDGDWGHDGLMAEGQEIIEVRYAYSLDTEEIRESQRTTDDCWYTQQQLPQQYSSV